MKNIVTAAMMTAAIPAFGQGVFKEPATRSEAVRETLHGREMVDNYRWLEDKTAPDVLQWTRAQHDAAMNFLLKNTKEFPGLQEEFTAAFDRDVKGAPFFEGEREFFWARQKGDAQSKLYTRLNGKEILIFDPLKIDPTGKSAVTGSRFTKKGDRVAIGIQNKGDEISTYRIIDTKTGEQIGDLLPGLNNFSWTRDEKHAYITLRTPELVKNQTPLPTYLHKLGDDHKNDVFMTAPPDAKDNAWVYDTDEGDWTVFGGGDFYSNFLKIRKTGTNEPPKEIYSSKKYRSYFDIRHGKMFVFTNHEAPNFKVMVADLDKPEFENWRTFIPEGETVLSGFEVTSDYVITQDKKDVMSRLMAYDLNGKFLKQIELPELGNVSGLKYHKETNNLYVTLATFTAPSKLYKLDGKTLKWEFVYQVPTPIDTKDIVAEIKFYPGKDGVKIPAFVIHKKGLKLDGNNPTLLYGYGGFNNGIEPGFISSMASFINRGGVYVNTGLRGGDEYGEKWHNDGMLLKKQNTFDDFIAAAEWLIREKYTNPQKLVAQGGSNGGLLVGAVMTQRPELFKAIVCQVPLLDMVRYHKFLIARYWIPEYGDPEKQEDFENILKYSPYHNIKPGVNYPTTLIWSGANDVRVDPLHAKKFAAALQNNPGQKAPILLVTDYESGHGSGKPLQSVINDEVLRWRFIMSELGM
ncbi:MAG TPA: prolyl oligopeptidase family serine peptidase [Patescibacteria group bacterium]|nr:prolyl oligopeptidase family serine peptidase [Patescibacteria group bacterium]